MWASLFASTIMFLIDSNMQVPYPLISLVTRLPQTLDGKSPLIVHTRTFETFSLSFRAERSAADVFDSIKELTVACMAQ